MEELIVCGGCNAKIGAGNLGKLLRDLPKCTGERLLVGFDSADDAAVIQLTEDLAIIQTVVFFSCYGDGSLSVWKDCGS